MRLSCAQPSGGTPPPAETEDERLRRLIRSAEIKSRNEAIAVIHLLQRVPWDSECPPVRAEGCIFSLLTDEERDPKHWRLPKLPDLSALQTMGRAMEQILAHFDQGELDGQRWQLRHTHALWGIFFPGTPPLQKLKDRQMYELDTDMPPGEIEAVIIVAMCMLFNDDLVNTTSDAQPQAARNVHAIACAVDMPFGVGAVDEACASRKPCLVATNLRPSQCVQRSDCVTARSKSRCPPQLQRA